MVESNEAKTLIATKTSNKQLLIKKAEIEFIYNDEKIAIIENIVLQNILVDTGANDWLYINWKQYLQIKDELNRTNDPHFTSKWEEKEKVILAGNIQVPLARIRLLANVYVYSEDQSTRVYVGQVMNVGAIQNSEEPLLGMFGLEGLNLYLEDNFKYLFASKKNKQCYVGQAMQQ